MAASNEPFDVEPSATSPDIGTMREVEPTQPLIDTTKMRPGDASIQYEDREMHAQDFDRERSTSQTLSQRNGKHPSQNVNPPRSFDEVVRDRDLDDDTALNASDLRSTNAMSTVDRSESSDSDDRAAQGRAGGRTNAIRSNGDPSNFPIDE